jgi:hypothetical protein
VELGATNRALSAEIDAERNVTFRGRAMSVRDATGEVADAVKTRTARAATTNITSIWGESIPLWGIAINVAATGFEMKMACDTMRDMHELELVLGGSGDADEADRVCGFQIPTVGEIQTAVVAAPSQLWTTVTSDVEELTDTEIEAPDRGSAPEEGWFDGWFD